MLVERELDIEDNLSSTRSAWLSKLEDHSATVFFTSFRAVALVISTCLLSIVSKREFRVSVFTFQICSS